MPFRHMSVGAILMLQKQSRRDWECVLGARGKEIGSNDGAPYHARGKGVKREICYVMLCSW